MRRSHSKSEAAGTSSLTYHTDPLEEPDPIDCQKAAQQTAQYDGWRTSNDKSDATRDTPRALRGQAYNHEITADHHTKAHIRRHRIAAHHHSTQQRHI